jgi:hypothetical protein
MASKKPATGKATNTKKRISGMGGDSAPQSIFKDNSNIVPGELIVQLDANAAASVTQNIPRGRRHTVTTENVKSFGVSVLDQTLTGSRDLARHDRGRGHGRHLPRYL